MLGTDLSIKDKYDKTLSKGSCTDFFIDSLQYLCYQWLLRFPNIRLDVDLIQIFTNTFIIYQRSFLLQGCYKSHYYL